MRYLIEALQTLVFGVQVRRWAWARVWLTALLSSFFVVGCGSVTTEPESTESADLKLVKEQLRPLCFKPAEVAAAEAKGDDDIFFAFVETTGEAVTSRDRWVLDQALFQDGFVFKYDVDAPLENLRLVPIRDSPLGVDPVFQAQAGPRTRPSGSNSGVPPPALEKQGQRLIQGKTCMQLTTL